MQSVAGPMTTINTILAEALDHIATYLEAAVAEGTEFNVAVQAILTEIITNHGAAVFNGNGYSDEWQVEAAARGLPNLKTTLDALPELISEPAMELFEKYKVFSHREMHSRYEIGLEQYVLSIGVEAQPHAGDRQHHGGPGRAPLPDRTGHQRGRAQGRRRRLRPDRPAGGQRPARRPARGRCAGCPRHWLPTPATTRWPRRRTPTRSCSRPWPQVRTAIDALEALVADDLWPLPTYQEMLYIL